MKYFLFIFILIYSFGHSATPTDTLKLNGAFNGSLPENLYVSIDCAMDKSAEQVFNEFRIGNFKKVSKGPVSSVVNFGVTDCVYWFALIVKNEAEKPENYLWNFYNEGIAFTFYEPQRDLQSYVRKEVVSHHTKRSERDVPLRSISFRISLEPGETKTVFVKTELVDRKNLYFPTDISTEADVLWWELDYSFLLGRYFGFFFFAAIFNLCLFIILKKRFYGVMLGYILSLLAFTLIEYLHDLYVIPEWLYPFWTNIPRSFFLVLALIFNIKILQNFIQLGRYDPKLNGYLNTANNSALGLVLIFLLLHFIFYKSQEISQALNIWTTGVQLILLFIFIVSILKVLINKIPYVWHYLGGNVLLILSVILYILNNSFQITHVKQFFSPGNMIIAFAFEVVYLMIIFTLKYKNDFDEFSKNLLQSEVDRNKLTEELISAQEKERMRIAQDIHDGIGGSLQAFRFLLSQEKLENESKLQKILKDINIDFKQLIHKLSPRSLRTQGLFQTIENDVTIYSENLQIDLNLIGNENLISWGMKLSLYRIYQELVTNALKHAKHVSFIGISIAIDQDEVRLMVEDDGKVEISPEKFENSEALGLTNIRSRVAYYQGEIYIHNTSNGTSVIINLPL